MKKLLTVTFVLLAVPLMSQQSNVIDDVISQRSIDLQNAAYLALTAGDMIDDSTDPTEALNFLQDLGWSIKKADSNRVLTLGDSAVLLMNSLEVKGGIMFSLTKQPRYAYKEMVFRGILKPEEDLKRAVSGIEFLAILTELMEGNS